MNRTTTLVLAARDSASRTIGKLHGALGNLGNRTKVIGGQFAGMGAKVAKAGTIMGAVAVAGVGALVAGLGMAVKASMDEQTGIDRLGKTLQNNIPNWKGNTDAIEKQIAAREKLAFSDDSLRDSLGALVARTHNLKQAQDLQATAMDLARAKNISLMDATNLLVKVQGGQFKALKGLGITLKPVTTAMDALHASTKKATAGQIAQAKAADAQATAAAATAAITKATAGQAEAYAKSGKASFETFNIAIGDLVEDIGSALIPMATAFATMLTGQVLPVVRSIAAGFGDWVAANQPLLTTIASLVSGALAGLVDVLFNKIVPGVAGVVGAIGNLIAANGPLIGQIRDGLNVGLQALGEAVKWAGDNLNIVVPFIAGPLVAAFVAWAVSAGAAAAATLLALAPLLLVGAAIGALAVVWTNNWGNIQEIVGGAVDAIIASVREIIGAITGIASAIAPVVVGVAEIVGKVIAQIAYLFETVAPIVKHIVDRIVGIVAGIADVVGGIAQWVSDVLDVFNGPEGFVGAVKKVAADVVGLLVAIPGKLVAAAPDFLAAALGLGRAIVKGIADGLVGLAGALGGAIADAVNSIFPINIGPIHIERSGIRIDPIRIPNLVPQDANGNPMPYPGTQHGGVVQRGVPRIVGERRPELFVPDVTGRILPRIGSGGGSVVFEAGAIVVNGAEDPAQWSARFVQQLSRRLRREGII